MSKTSRKRKARQRLAAAQQSIQAHYLPVEIELIADGTVPRFDMRPAYNGSSRLSVRGFDAPVVVELATASFERDQVKINADHDRKRIVGHSESQSITDQGIFASGFLSKVNGDVTRIVTESKNKYPHEASIEARFPPAEFVPAGQKRIVNGHEQSGPFYLARNAVITGIAILDTGADRTTTVSIAAENSEGDGRSESASSEVSNPKSPNKETKIMSAQLQEFLKSKGFDYETVTPEQLQAAFAEQRADESATLAAAQAATATGAPKKPEPAKTPATSTGDQTVQAAANADAQNLEAEAYAEKRANDMIEKMRKAKAAEDAREHAITEICAEFNRPLYEVEADGKKVSVDLQAHAIEKGFTVTEARLAAMHYALQQKNGGGGTVAIHDSGKYDREGEVIEAALAISAGLQEPDIKRMNLYSEEVMNKATSSHFQGYKPSRLGQLTMIEAGLNHGYISPATDEYGGMLMKAHRKNRERNDYLEASGFTTLSMPGIFRNVAVKMLMAAYTREPSYIPFVFGRTTASDFKVMYGYQLEGSGMLERLAGDGEIKHGAVVENEFTAKLETYAKMLAWTRKDRINDDMGSLGRTADMLGQMAFKAREFAASQFVIQPTPTFWNDTATVGNPVVNSFAGNDFGIDGMSTSYTNFTGITDSDGLPITVGGGNVLLPNNLEILGRQVANDTEIKVEITGSTTATEKVSNPHAGTFQYRSTPWINNAIVNKDKGTFTGLAAADRPKTWYRFSNPQSAPALQVIYLNGQDTPTIESDDTDFNTMGIQFRCFFDFGFGATDQRYAQRNIGA